MGQAASSPSESLPPPLADDTDDSEDEVLLLDKILHADEAKEEEVSIVFFDQDEEEEVDEKDIYYDEKDSFTDDFVCFGLPLFSITDHFSAFAPTQTGKGSTNEDEDEDPTQNIESLQMELKVVDAIYNHHTRNAKKVETLQEEKQEEEEEKVQEMEVQEEKETHSDNKLDEEEQEEEEDLDEDEDPLQNVESLQRELERAEENYVPPKSKTADDNDCGSSLQMSDGEQSQRSSSFIDLQQLLFSSPPGDNGDDTNSILKTGSVSSSASLFSSSSSTKTCRIVEIYETRSTQLKPQPEHEKEQVPLERRGVPFRKCRDPGCSCHHSTTKHRDNSRSRRRDRNRAIVEKYHVNNKHGDDRDDDEHDEHNEESSTFESRQLKRRSALHRLQKQREKLLAMDQFDEDDQTEVTAGSSSSSSSRYSGYSIRSECQINARKHHTNNHRGHRRDRSQSEDLDARITQASSFSKGNRSTVSSTLSGTPASPPTRSPHRLPQADASNDSQGRKSIKQQSSPPQPPIPSLRPFGGSSNQRQTTYPSLLTQSCSKSLRKISSDLLETKETPRRCRSEDFIDGNTNINSRVESSGISKSFTSSIFRRSEDKVQTKVEDAQCSTSIDGSAAVTNQEKQDRVISKEYGGHLLSSHSPTCIMEEVHRNGSYPRSRTTQHQHENLLEQLDRIHQKKQDSSAQTGATIEREALIRNRSDSTNRSPVFDERERSLKDYRESIRILLQEEKVDRRQKLSFPVQKTLRRDSRKQRKRRRQQQQQREFQRAIKMADLYHNMGLIHYQQGRYETARHVLQCGVDALISNRCSSVPFSQEAWGEETDPFDDDYSNPYYASAPSKLLPVLPTLDEAAPHLSNSALLLAAELILAQAKIYAAQGSWSDTKHFSGKVLQWSHFQKQRLMGNPPTQPSHLATMEEQHKKYWKDWGSTIARAQVLFARCFEREHRPDIAMGYYQEALSVQKSVLGPNDVQAADTLYRMGNLHAMAGLLGLAGQCFDEALCLYRYHKSVTVNGGGHPQDDSAADACICADEATALAGLGWIFLVQNDLERALALTNEALDGMIRALGESHRNVLSLKHQLGCIQNAMAFPAAQRRREPPRVLAAGGIPQYR